MWSVPGVGVCVTVWCLCVGLCLSIYVFVVYVVWMAVWCVLYVCLCGMRVLCGGECGM